MEPTPRPTVLETASLGKHVAGCAADVEHLHLSPTDSEENAKLTCPTAVEQHANLLLEIGIFRR